jgi:hypothetical protein
LEQVALGDVDLYRSILHPFTMADLAKFDRPLRPNPEADEVPETEDLASLPF